MMKSFLKKYQFQFAGHIEVNGRRFVFRKSRNFPEEPVIYCWVLSKKAVSAKGEPIAIVYVGKASFGLPKRMSQHLSGFKNSTTGIKNEKYVSSKLKSNHELQVYVRKPLSYFVLGKSMNGCSIEEEFFIELIENNTAHSDNGILNRKRYPKN